ncbi:hypothetical protein VNO77_42033 [Canavalia gladiata]|uniref:O-methyltransferase C-terminal domain-containing protein n=1 Tax=Canavalia gladiata TaxID=3824 RepID=A0AAN9K1X9_CANGL
MLLLISICLRSLARHRVHQIQNSLSLSEIASLLPNQHPQLSKMLQCILPVLASNSLLNYSFRTNKDGMRERVYALSSISRKLYRSTHREFHEIWKDLKNAIVDPNNDGHLEEVHGNTELHIFSNAMAVCVSLLMERVLEVYKGFEVSTLVDVGGGVGHSLEHIISKYPSIKGINFDLPQVVRNAPPNSVSKFQFAFQSFSSRLKLSVRATAGCSTQSNRLFYPEQQVVLPKATVA